MRTIFDAHKFMSSPKFFQTDGDWDRVIWMTDQMKKLAGSAILVDKK
ncbi:MAG: hypothetical protein NWE89_16700 [Candidatus Bathyarchaeota archaeon]|nr:hypothetical protein [Candidatus Bathyarchaeota archaeon]